MEKSPDEIIQEALGKGITDFYVAYSGGKDSGIALDFMAKNYPNLFRGVVFVDTGIGIADTKKFIIDFCSRKNYPLTIMNPSDVIRTKTTSRGKPGEVFSYEKLVLTYGFPRQAFHTVTMQHLKYFPIRKFIYDKIRAGENPCIVGGIRKKESKRRKIKWSKYLYNDQKMWFVSPLFFKSNGWVYDYFITNKIERSPVYEFLELSGDCLCGAFATHSELKLIQQFYPETFNEIKRLEKLIQEQGTDVAKRNCKWGKYEQSTQDIESQTTMDGFVDKNIESIICSDCSLDDKEQDTKRFDDEMADIKKKLEALP